MPLWIAVVLLVFLAAGILIMLLLTRHTEKKRLMIAAIAVSTVALLVLLVYTLLTLIFVGGNDPLSELPGPSTGWGDAPMTIQVSPSASQYITDPTPAPQTPVPMPDDYDLPTSEVPELCPDILGLRSAAFEEMPTFGTQNEVTKYVLYNFLNNRFACEFYLKKDFAVDEGTGFSILDSACETAMTYYLFSSYKNFDMFTRDQGDDGKVYAKLMLVYTEPKYDLEAKAETLEFVMKNPVPIGGFRDFEIEKAYARKIHDFVAKKITYSPIGYNPERMFGMGKYEALQEAYNVLAEEENAAVCAGYARAFALIAQYAGINAAWVLGNETETESHAWNVIYPCDGSEAVLVDVTWDDTDSGDSTEQEYVSDRYFYVPLSEETEHTAAAHFDEFLRFVNEQ